MAGSPVAYLILAGLYLLGIVIGLVAGSHVGEQIGRRWEKPIPGMLAGAAIGGTLGGVAMYAVARWILIAGLGLPGP